MSHLSERITALVDGQLSPEAVERAHAHLAGCEVCRSAVEIERLTKSRLASLISPEPDDEFIGRLLALGGPAGPMTPRAGHVPGSPRPHRVAAPRPRAGHPAGAPGRSLRPGQRSAVRGRAVRRPALRRTRLAVAVFGALTVVSVGVGVAGGSLSSSASPAPVVPPVGSFVVQHASTTGDLPFVDVPAGWQSDPSSQGGGAGR